MCTCDYEAPSLYQATTHTARKPHVCYECRRNITPGERYESVIGVWDGEFSTYKTCKLCLDLRDFVTSKVECACWGHGNVRDDAIETARYSGVPGVLFGAWRREIAIRNAKHTKVKS